VTAESIGADQVWAGSDEVPGLTGAGVVVAVIDSGIDTRHNAFLRKRVIATKDFTGSDGLDRFGHGTHVASIIAGQPGATPDTRTYQGIASGALLLNLRVLGDEGSGVASDVVEAIDWTIEHRKEFDVRVINLSLGAPVLQPFRDDPLCEAVERAVKAGITVVAAAGNYGRTADGRSVYGGITAPGNSPYAITVGAVDTHGTAKRSDDTIAPYSSKGPTRYDLVIKPDLVAPGSHVVAAESADSYLAKTYPERHVAGTGANAYMQLSGTSMAAAVVSGAVAVLLEEQGKLKPNEVKATMQLTSSRVPMTALFEAGAGMLNLAAASNFIETRGEINEFGGIAYREPIDSSPVSDVQLSFGSIVQLRPIAGLAIVWDTVRASDKSVGVNAIVWDTLIQGNAIVWDTALGPTAIVWDTAVCPSAIVWDTAVITERTNSDD
jgi:serine protease AprX